MDIHNTVNSIWIIFKYKCPGDIRKSISCFFTRFSNLLLRWVNSELQISFQKTIDHSLSWSFNYVGEILFGRGYFIIIVDVILSLQVLKFWMPDMNALISFQRQEDSLALCYAVISRKCNDVRKWVIKLFHYLTM